MTYPEALAALLSLIGRDVSVSVLLPQADAPPGVMSMRGVLDRGDDLGAIAQELGLSAAFDQDSIRFIFKNQPALGNGFIVDRKRFVSARWDDHEPVPTLVITLVRDVVVRVVDEEAEWQRPSSGPLSEE